MHRAVDDMADKTTFHGYGPEQGYAFLRDAIAEGDYRARGVDIRSDEIFISDGAKSDLGNLGDIYAAGNVVAVTDPGYPVYVDSNVIDGRGGELVGGRWSNFIYSTVRRKTVSNRLLPKPTPMWYFLCSPANPTGVAFTRSELRGVGGLRPSQQCGHNI